MATPWPGTEFAWKLGSMTALRKIAPRASELAAALQEALASPGYRPPVLPSVALEVMGLSHQTDVDLGEVVRLLERDAVLAARVLALAQSARYASRSPVVTLRQAAVRLGLETLTHLVLQAALALRVFRAPGFDAFAKRVNLHAAAAAHVTREVCRRAKLPAENAFVAGLLHDIGISSCLLMVTERRCSTRSTPTPPASSPGGGSSPSRSPPCLPATITPPARASRSPSTPP